MEEHRRAGKARVDDVARLSLFDLIKTARTDMLTAMDSLPAEAALSRAGFGVPLVVAQQFSTAHQVLVSDADSYRKPWMVRQVIEGGLGENLFTSDGEVWFARRQPCAPVFGVQQMEALAATMAATAAELTESWRPGEIDIHGAMTDLTIRVALRGLLGTTSVRSDEPEPQAQSRQGEPPAGDRTTDRVSPRTR